MFPPWIKGDGVIETRLARFPIFPRSWPRAAEIDGPAANRAHHFHRSESFALVKTTVSGNTLQIDSEENLVPTKGITIILSSASLADVNLTGAINLTAKQLSGHDVKLESNGASVISVDGSVTNLEANLSGASKLNAKSLQTQTATVSLDGAS
jgi:predicted Fe-Mo cluster-binding NifX family protein